MEESGRRNGGEREPYGHCKIVTVERQKDNGNKIEPCFLLKFSNLMNL